MNDFQEGSGMMLLHQVMHLSEYLAVKGLERLNLKPGQAGILFWLDKEGELSQRQLSKKLSITPPSVTAALRKLEMKGLIRKESDPEDQRVFKVCLTEEGKGKIHEVKSLGGELEQVIYEGIPEEEALLFRRTLLDMRENLMKAKELKGRTTYSILAEACLNRKPNAERD